MEVRFERLQVGLPAVVGFAVGAAGWLIVLSLEWNPVYCCVPSFYVSMLDCLCSIVGCVVSLGLFPWVVWCMCSGVGFFRLVSLVAFARLWAGLWFGSPLPKLWVWFY